jgi:5'-nucleotidase
MNGGGLRADLPAGNVSYGALFEALPFANRVATMKMRGGELKALFAANATHDKGVLSISGATVDVRCEGPRPSVQITLPSGRVVTDEQVLTVAASDFLALGGDDLSAGGPHEVHVDLDGPTMRDVVGAGLKRRGTIRPDDPALYDPAKPRLKLPSPRPVRCD